MSDNNTQATDDIPAGLARAREHIARLLCAERLTPEKQERFIAEVGEALSRRVARALRAHVPEKVLDEVFAGMDDLTAWSEKDVITLSDRLQKKMPEADIRKIVMQALQEGLQAYYEFIEREASVSMSLSVAESHGNPQASA